MPENERLYAFRCPECGAAGIFPGGLPGGPALCPHPSSTYEAERLVPESKLSTLTAGLRKIRTEAEASLDELDDNSLNALSRAIYGWIYNEADRLLREAE